MTAKYLFVDESLRVHTGEDARALLEVRSDLTFLEPGKGVLKVPQARWEAAQRYERNTWLDAGAHAVEDRNELHAQAFGGYHTLRGRAFLRALELGCGPFTNLRCISRTAKLHSAVLLDPLLESYLHHRHCTYRHGVLVTGPSRLDTRLQVSRLGRIGRRALARFLPRTLLDGVPVERMISTSIEKMPDCGTFALIVLINVIEHCFDIDAIFRSVLRLCEPGCVFVFHDRLFDSQRVKQSLTERFDAGHPLRVPGQMIEDFLNKHFESLFVRHVHVTDTLGEIDLSERGIYFIGERRETAASS